MGRAARGALAASALLAALAAAPAPAQSLAPNPRGVYATIDLRGALETMGRLQQAYGTDKRVAMREVAGRASIFMPPVLYELANALVEERPDDAVFWYQVGRIRAVYDALRCRDATARRGIEALRAHMSEGLRRELFYRRDRLVATARKAIAWDLANPRDYDQRWISLYGDSARTSDGSEDIFVPESEWPAILQHVHEAHLQSVQAFAGGKK